MQYKAFVSATFEDLKQHRSVVISALRHAGIHVDPMEDWMAATDEPEKFSQDRLKGCHLCILLVAYRRGHVPKGEVLSVTQLEYEAARKSKISILVFMLDEDEPWRARFNELESDPLVRKWRAELQERHGTVTFGLDPQSIQIAPALTRWIAEREVQPRQRPIFISYRRKDEAGFAGRTLRLAAS